MLRQIGDRILRFRIKRDEKEIKIGFLITGFVIILLFANVFYLNFIVLKDSSGKADSQASQSQIKPTNEQAQIQTPIPTQVVQQSKPVQPASEVTYKDYYINLGSGSNRSTEWADVAGTLNTFDISDYKNIKEARLESNTNVPTANGTISVRLFNKTDSFAVWNSERTVQAEKEGSLLISEALNYPHGPKMYQVQMKSQLGVDAVLTQARIHIVAE